MKTEKEIPFQSIFQQPASVTFERITEAVRAIRRKNAFCR
jgi:hypothetical protein